MAALSCDSKRGFFWRGKLIRPEEVIAKRFG